MESYLKSELRPYTVFRVFKIFGDINTQPTYSSSMFSGSASVSGYRLRNWRRIIALGGNATTPFTGTYRTIEVGYANCRIDGDKRVNAFNPWFKASAMESSFSNYMNLVPLSAHVDAGALGEATSRATEQLYQNLYKAHHQLQGGVILGEIGKTAKLLAGTARSLKRGVLDYTLKAVGIRRKAGLTGGLAKSNAQKQLAATYLEATYGWQPLVMDCQDAAKALARLVVDKDRTRLQAYASSAKQSAQGVEALGSGNFYFNREQTLTETAQVIYRGFLQGLPYEAGSAPLERIISMSGFDLRSFVPNLWELTPYSFLVDYFSNIGDCLYALSCDTGLVNGLQVTTIRETQRKILLRPDMKKSLAVMATSPDYRNLTGSGGLGYALNRLTSVTRAVTGMPLLLPRLKGFDLPWRQFANIGALLAR